MNIKTLKLRVGPNGAVEMALPTSTLTDFQLGQVVEIAKSASFDYFCGGNPTNGRETAGPIDILYYTKDGELNVRRVGVNKVLRNVSTGQVS